MTSVPFTEIQDCEANAYIAGQNTDEHSCLRKEQQNNTANIERATKLYSSDETYRKVQ